jgi:hypothetical protein
MFRNALEFNADISGWDVSASKTFKEMFRNATDFNAPISPWNVNKGKKIQQMSDGADVFNQQLCWNIRDDANVTSMFNTGSSTTQNLDYLLIPCVTPIPIASPAYLFQTTQSSAHPTPEPCVMCPK